MWAPTLQRKHTSKRSREKWFDSEKNLAGCCLEEGAAGMSRNCHTGGFIFIFFLLFLKFGSLLGQHHDMPKSFPGNEMPHLHFFALVGLLILHRH